MVNGSVALQGAVDNFLLLYRKRGENDARLFVCGRDIEEEQELLVTFQRDIATWTLKGPSTTNAGTYEQQEILDMLKKHQDGLRCKVLAELLDKNANTVRNLLVKLRKEEKVSLKNNIYVINRSQRSNCSLDSQRSNHSHPLMDESLVEPKLTTDTEELTTVDYGSYSQRSHPLQAPAKPVQTPKKTELTTLTTHSPRTLLLTPHPRSSS